MVVQQLDTDHGCRAIGGRYRDIYVSKGQDDFNLFNGLGLRIPLFHCHCATVDDSLYGGDFDEFAICNEPFALYGISGDDQNIPLGYKGFVPDGAARARPG